MALEDDILPGCSLLGVLPSSGITIAASQISDVALNESRRDCGWPGLDLQVR
jgi:hypothetical protein